MVKKHKKNIFITTPIYYVNDSPHLGHAYTTIATDILARHYRLLGTSVKFLTGTDEHGQKIEKSAIKAEIPVQEFVDAVSLRFQNLVNTKNSVNLLNISNDDFIRTTESRHKKSATKFWERLVENGFIYKDKYSGWYSVRDEAYYQESELIDGKAPTGAEVEWLEEESYFFKLSAFQDKLLKFYEENPKFIFPESRYNEVKSFVESGLKDLSISRSNISWGIKVPNDKKHIMYVWIDALVNYLTSCNYIDENSAEFKDFWINSNVIHLVGKDILRFHAVYWPAFLMAANLPLPKNIVAHGWWTIEGEKMSKSLGNVISPEDLITKFGLEPLRFILFREMAFGNDGNFSVDLIKGRINAELANNIGNLVQRSISMLEKYFYLEVPKHPHFDDGNFDEKTFQLLTTAYKVGLDDSFFVERLSNFDFQKSLEVILVIATKANEYIESMAPWKLYREDSQKCALVIYTLLEVIRVIAIALQAFMPVNSNKILDWLQVDKKHRTYHNATADFAIKVGTKISKPEILFRRID